MKKHLLCLTVDTDPDGLSGKTTNRQTLSFAGLKSMRTLPEELAAFPGLGRIPITWFVRADGQLESILGNPAHLIEIHHHFWSTVQAAGDELGWHPHLYRQAGADDRAVLITHPAQANDELERLWNKVRNIFHPTAFRNGEGWHTPETYTMIERLGFNCDSTAIPGRNGGSGHPMKWDGAPNQPYFPAATDLCQSGPERSCLELPMNTWRLRAPHDEVARIRYMNPAVHPQLFSDALRGWENSCRSLPSGMYVWVMIFHPDEILPSLGSDALYARSPPVLCENLVSIALTLARMEHEFEWLTISEAARRWRERELMT